MQRTYAPLLDHQALKAQWKWMSDMIRWVSGSVFDVAPVLDAVLLLVDCMGSEGNAYCVYHQRFPKSFRSYKAACVAGNLKPGDVFYVEVEDGNPHWIVHLVSTVNLIEMSKLEWIACGLESLKTWILENHTKRIGLSFTDGCTKGLIWPEVSKCIAMILGDVECEVLVFEPMY